MIRPIKQINKHFKLGIYVIGLYMVAVHKAHNKDIYYNKEISHVRKGVLITTIIDWL